MNDRSPKFAKREQCDGAPRAISKRSDTEGGTSLVRRAWAQNRRWKSSGGPDGGNPAPTKTGAQVGRRRLRRALNGHEAGNGGHSQEQA